LARFKWIWFFEWGKKILSRRELYEYTIKEASELIRERRISPSELIESVLDRISEVECRVKAYVTVMKEDALAAAKEAEKEREAGFFRGPLHGIPIAVKDIIDVKGVRTTCGSKVRVDYFPPVDATVVERLKASGAIIIGKAVTHEFAFDVFSPPTHNPWDLSRIPGGSSGGSGAAVAAGMCLGAIGTDSGGSLRIPASLCGTVGVKPTYGLVSKRGATMTAWTLDHIGPMTRTVEDAALMLNAVVGFDPGDPSSVQRETFDCARTLRDGVHGLRLGIPIDYFESHLDPEIGTVVRSAIDILRGQGARTSELRIPYLEYAFPAVWAIGLVEAASYHQGSLRQSAELYGEDVRTEIEIGALMPGRYYVNAQRVRGLFRAALKSVFEKVDVLVMPTVPVAASKIGQKTFRFGDVEEDVSSTYARFCAPFNLAGVPALTVPCGFTHEGLPIGLQIAGRPFEEEMILRVAQAYESSTDWHLMTPSI
jgi:aspartyl-tRNA(Asn)/glutamyl-tRNA(Gln) amidotransferase subunit A